MTIKTDTKLLAEECVKLNKIIKENEEKIETLKKELQKKMLEEKIDVIEGDGYKVRHTSYNNKYSSVIAECFSNLSTEKNKQIGKKSETFIENYFIRSNSFRFYIM